MVEWKEVTCVDQVKIGTKLKIVGISPKNSYRAITVKDIVINNYNSVEVIINKEKNYYFNLSGYLDDRPLWARWVKQVFYKTGQNIMSETLEVIEAEIINMNNHIIINEPKDTNLLKASTMLGDVQRLIKEYLENKME